MLKTKYTRRAGTSGMGGQLYEIELLMLSLLNAIAEFEEKHLDEFRLATNMDEAGDFDDLVFKCWYKENGVRKSKTVFVHAKHRESKKGQISIDSQETGDLTLRKHLSSYLKIKQHGIEKDHPIFKDGLDNSEFVIFTNAGFDAQKSKSSVEEVSIGHDQVLYLGASRGKCYKLKPDADVVDALKYSLDFEILAKELANAVSSGCFDRNKSIFKDYDTSLGGSVIETISEREGKMREDFLKGLQNGDLSSAFFQEVMKKKEFAKKSLDELMEELKMKKLQLPKGFGNAKHSKLSLPCKEISDADLEKFLADLRLFVAQPNERELSGIIKEKIRSLYKTEQSETDKVFAQVKEQIQKWWVEGDEYINEENKFFQDAARVSIRFDVKSPIASFTGRTKELKDLHKAVARNQNCFNGTSQITCLSGLGGIGKTELARKYASIYGNSYDGNIIWINAESEAALHDSFTRLAKDKLYIQTTDANNKEKHIKSIVEDVYKYFEKRKCLIVFDNAENNGYIKTFLAGSKMRYFLITSRNREWDRGIEVVDLKKLKLGEAVELVKQGLHINDETQNHEIEALVQMLQGFPLAIQQAVAYIEDQRVKGEFRIYHYLEEYEKKARDMLDSKIFKGIDNDYKKSTYTTWKLTVDKIAEDKQNGELALKILNTIAFLAPGTINRETFIQLAVNEEAKLKSAVRCLVKYSMVNGEKKQSVLSVHRLVQEVTRLEMERRGNYEGVIKETHRLLIQNYNSGENAKDWTNKRQLLPHFEFLMYHIDNWMKISPENKTTIEIDYLDDLLNKMSDGYIRLGYFRRIKEVLERALDIEEKHYGPDHNNVAETLAKLGNAYGDLGDHYKQIDLQERALKIMEKNYGPENSNVAVTLTDLSTAYGSLGYENKKKDLLERALKINEKTYGRSHYKVALTLTNLSNAYWFLHDRQKQLESLERALRIKEEHYGPDHLYVSAALDNLASACGGLGQHDRKKELLERSLKIKEENYGPDNYPVAATLTSLAEAYGDLGDHHKEKELLERALKIKKDFMAGPSWK